MSEENIKIPVFFGWGELGQYIKSGKLDPELHKETIERWKRAEQRVLELQKEHENLISQKPQ